MLIKNPKLVISAASIKQWPESTMPEILLCGRSNVGKSTFINTMVKRKSLAYVGKTPGKTRLLNFYDLDEKIMFVDAPGYGFQKDRKSDYANFGKLMDDYIEKRSNLKLCILLLDIRRDPSNDDMMMIEYFAHHQIPHLIILTKSDKLSYSQQLKQKNKVASLINMEPTSLILFKHDDPELVEKTWEKISTFI